MKYFLGNHKCTASHYIIVGTLLKGFKYNEAMYASVSCVFINASNTSTGLSPVWQQAITIIQLGLHKIFADNILKCIFKDNLIFRFKFQLNLLLKPNQTQISIRLSDGLVHNRQQSKPETKMTKV